MSWEDPDQQESNAELDRERAGKEKPEDRRKRIGDAMRDMRDAMTALRVRFEVMVEIFEEERNRLEDIDGV